VGHKIGTFLIQGEKVLTKEATHMATKKKAAKKTAKKKKK
jgi:hypothetical protein